MTEPERPRLRKGFAAMDPEKRRAIARKGGASVPGEKRSFAKDRALAASAGRKGGETSHGGGRAARKHMKTLVEKITAPFTPEQVAALNAWQANDYVHPFTCGGDRGDDRHRAYQALHPSEDYGQLIATREGWHCPVCSYRQLWAHKFMAMPQ